MAKAIDLDAKVVALMKDVKNRRSKLGKLSKPQWITSGVLEVPNGTGSGGGNTITLQVMSNILDLVYVRRAMLVLRDAIGDANRDLDLDLPLVWRSYQINDWISDIEQRIKIINIKAEQDKLAALEAKLNTLTSEDQRRAFALAEIELELT